MTRISHIVLIMIAVLFWPQHSSALTTTHTGLEPVALSSLSENYEEARLWFLPDWQNDTRSYNSNTSDDQGGGDTVKVCSDYGFISPSDLDLDVYTCFSYDTVPVHGLSCYNSCKCKPEFTYTSANCNASAGYVLSGKSCEGKYQSCTCSKECCSDSMCRSDQRCSSGSCVSTCTNTIMASDCAAECKNTGSGACTRDGVTYYAACGSSKCGSNQVCSSGSCVCASGYKLCGTTCIPSSNCCTDADCSGGQQCSSGSCGCASGYKSCNGSCIPSSNCCTDADCGSDQSCSSGSCVNNCTPLTDESGCSWGSKSCSNNCGGYRQCCKTAAEYCKEQGYTSGITCETGQTTETCSADSSYKKCSGEACPSSQNCKYGCKTYSTQSGCTNICTVCKTAAEYCKEQGYTSGITCETGQTTETCSADSSYKKCNGEACPSSQNCTYGCKTYSSQSGCTDICTVCKTAAEYCKEQGYASGITCEAGQTTETCSADSSYKKCIGSACPSSKTCSYGCKTYSSQSGCSNVCTVCKTAAEYCKEQGYNSGITCEAGQTTETCSADSSYKKCTGEACPSSPSCDYGCQTYSTQSGCSNVCTACYPDNCRNRTDNTPPANASCSTYYSDCSSKCQAWSCNSGYYKDGNTCKSNDCKVTPVTPPANATCSSKNSCDICIGWKCNSGYTQSGSSCVCATTCADKVTSKPENSSYTTEQCTACGFSKTINTGWKCNDGYNNTDTYWCTVPQTLDCGTLGYNQSSGSCSGKKISCPFNNTKFICL